MSETKFTPGPWYVCPKDGYTVRRDYAGAKSVAAVSSIKPTISIRENQADAHLISAAPDLFNVADTAPAPPSLANQDDLRQFVSLYADWYVHRCAALSKARGEQ